MTADALTVALEPVRQALLEDAGATAEAILAAARRSATDTVAAAEREVEAEVERARRRSEAIARAAADQALARARRDAHRAVLEARDEVRRRLETEVRAAVLRLPEDPRYERLVERLHAVARSQLGEDATVYADPEAGGVVAESDGRRVDYTLVALAERALAGLADRVEMRWT